MTRLEIANIIKSFGLPAAYHEFEDATDKVLPYVCYYYDGSDDFYADNVNYAKIENLTIELYTKNKDFAIEAEIEKTLNSNKITYTKYDAFLDSERCIMTTYYTEVLINE